jgi:hypothetical protein
MNMGFLDRLFGGGKAKAKKRSARKAPQPPRSVVTKPDFPLGDNIISDPDIRTMADLKHFYPLPAGHEYQQTDEGVPVVIRLSDNMPFSFLIEEGLMTFNEPYTKADGRVAYRTTEVFRRP